VTRIGVKRTAILLTLALACSCSAPSVVTRIAAPLVPPSPVTNPVPLKPEQVILPDEEFPLGGFRVAQDELVGKGWERRWTRAAPGVPFSWVSMDIRVLGPSTSAAATWLAEEICDSVFDPPARSMTEIEVPVVGESARACRYDWGGKPGAVLVYKTAIRNVAIEVGVDREIASRASLAETIDLLASLADYQVWIIERVAPLPGVTLRPAPQVRVPTARIAP